MCCTLNCGCSVKNFKNECVEIALDTLKQHFYFLVASHKELMRQKEIPSRQQQNDSLLTDDCSNKRKLDSHEDYYAKKENRFPGLELSCLNISSESNINSPPKTTDLNAAISSEQLLDSSAMSQSQNETIGETENVSSPRGARCNWSARRKQLRQRNHEKEEEEGDKWIRKRHKSPSPITIGKRRANLSLNSNRQKFKQSRLQFDKNKNVDENMVKESPNLYSLLTQAQKSRSMILKTKNEQATNTNLKKSSITPKPVLTPTLNVVSTDHYFDFSDSKFATPKPKSNPQSHFKTPDSDESSVVILTPTTPDIIFLDDSNVGPTQINTMDLLNDLRKLDNAASLTNLRRYEAQTIDQQKRINQQKSLPKPTATITKPTDCTIPKTTTLLAAKTLKPTVAITNPTDSEVSKTAALVKAEPVTQRQEATNESTKLWEADLQAFKDTLKNDEDMAASESEEEEIVRPIIVKTEADIPTRKLSFREHYGFDCKNCEKFVKFFKDTLNAKQIEDQMRNCEHNKYLARPQTPEGFWNPLMVDFSEDDARNEVLIDNRFRDRKRN